MRKHVYTIAGATLLSLSCLAEPAAVTCDEATTSNKNLSELEKVAAKVVDSKAGCGKEPTPEMFAAVCAVVYTQRDASSQDWDDVVYKFQENMWNMACADPAKMSLTEARPLLQKWWLANREKFKCDGYPQSLGNHKNIAKFATDIGFYSFLNSALKEYKLDMNFIDPEDKKTVLDFVIESKERLEKQKPRNENMIMDFGTMYDLLRKNGAKTAKEL